MRIATLSQLPFHVVLDRAPMSYKQELGGILGKEALVSGHPNLSLSRSTSRLCKTHE